MSRTDPHPNPALPQPSVGVRAGLRRRLEVDPARPVHLITGPGGRYRCEP